MQHYEIRVLKDNGSLSLKIANDYISSNAAIAAAQRIARGKPFEVWRGDYCVYVKDRPEPVGLYGSAIRPPLESRRTFESGQAFESRQAS